MSEPIVSVIIPTKNSARKLEDCLSSARNQTFPRVEVIVVDNHSVDSTLQIAAKFAQVFTKGPERSTQRNFGASVSHGSFLLFLDSDMEMTPEVVLKAVRACDQPEISGVCIPETAVGKGYWAKCRRLEKLLLRGDESFELPRFYRREKFFAYEGFDEEIQGGNEDLDLPLRMKNMGERFARITPLIVNHEEDLTLALTVRKKYYYGKTILKYIRRHRRTALVQYVPVRTSFMRRWRLALRDPKHFFGLLLMKQVEYAAGLIGILSSL